MINFFSSPPIPYKTHLLPGPDVLVLNTLAALKFHWQNNLKMEQFLDHKSCLKTVPESHTKTALRDICQGTELSQGGSFLRGGRARSGEQGQRLIRKY